jgi:predicted HD phosphohydrolase
LELQGGTFMESEAKAFMQQPYASEAVRLRRYDDLAKLPLKVTPPLSHFESYVSQAAS